MARCKECLHYEVCAKEGRLVQVDEHTWDEYNKLDDVEQFCTNYFTADVVPKSEVEKLVQDSTRLVQENETLKDNNEHLAVLLEEAKDEANRYKRYYFHHDYDKMIAEAKAEVARGIFGDIERIIVKSAALMERIRLLDYNEFAELKKKYIGDNEKYKQKQNNEREKK